MLTSIQKVKGLGPFLTLYDLKTPLSIDMRKCVEGFVQNKLVTLFPRLLMCITRTNGL